LLSQITFEEFQRLSIKVGKIVEAEKVEGSKKLVKLKVDLGGEVKQSLAGLAEVYNLEDLKGKLVVVLTNLKPRKLFGLESEVMLLAAVHDKEVSLIVPDKDIPLGSKVT